MKKIALLFSILGIARLSAQESATRKDSLQGGLRVERTCFDVLQYDLNIKINPVERSIVGFNEITFKVIDKTTRIQLDLFANMRIDSIVFNKRQLQYKREFNAVFIDFPEILNQNSEQKVTFYYAGNPIVAKRAPWDGGFVFRKDSNGNDFIGVACQGTGASLWFPCKDSQSDEPDQGATIKVAIPNGLTNVSNGRLLGSTDLKNGYTRWDWEVKNPINSYDITVNIVDYVHFGENYKGLDLDFYVLRENEAKAKIQFEVVKPMMDCFQAKFGKYPFATDGYKLVETSYLGMEHQSAVAYGNKYLKGYLGSDLSGTGVGLLFDFIIIHESGHEWFGNSITSRDIADMWIHEGFTCYTESVFLECQYGYEKAQIYINGLKKNIQNDKPIIGPFGINKEGSSDMYYKGALLLNTLRSVVNDDDKWWKILLKYSETFRHKIIDTQTVINFFNQESAINLTPIFNQYLQYKDIPTLELRLKKKKLQYKWKTDVANFNMPIDINIDNKITRLYPSNKWNTTTFIVKQLKSENIATNRFFVNVSIK
jgi:aminopeptidase N